MLKKGFLATTGIFLTISHTKKIIDQYAENINDIFSLISKCERGEEKIDESIDGEICHDSFKRLNWFWEIYTT